MTVLSTFSNGGTFKDYRDTFNAMLADIAALKAGSATPAPTPTVYFAASAISATEGNGGTKNLVMTAKRSTTVGAVTATATFVQGSAGAADFSGNALPGTKSFVFADGSDTATATVTISGDTDVESDETFGYQLVAPSGYALGSPSSITGTILNDDTGSATVSAPSGFTAQPPFSISRGGSGQTSTFTTDYSSTATKPTSSSTFYVKPNGNPDGAGTSYATAVNSLSIAVALANAAGGTVRVLVEAGIYRRHTASITRTASPASGTYRACLSTPAIACNLILEPYVAGTRFMSVVSNALGSTFTATADPNIYVATTTGTSNGILCVDYSNLDVDGTPRLITPLIAAPASAAAPWSELNALWTKYSAVKDKPTDGATYGMGACWYDATNSKLYVRTFDNRLPVSGTDMDMLGNHATNCVGAATANPSTATRTLWFSGGIFMGGYAGAMQVAGNAGVSMNFYGDNCAFNASYGYGGFAWDRGGGMCVLLNCTASYNVADGFNYHAFATATTQGNNVNAHEIGCRAKWNGWNTGGTNNSTTAHDQIFTVRVNGEYLNAQDRSVCDINLSRNWALGCVNSTRRAADGTGQSSAWTSAQASNNSQSTLHWLDACRGIDGAFGAPDYYFDAYPLGTINFASTPHPPAPTHAGTFADY